MNQLPEWLATALLGAALAALGYVLKLFIELYQSAKEKRRIKRSRLIELLSLLRATHVAFLIQNKHAINLTEWIKENHKEISQKGTGYEAIMSGAFNYLKAEKKELHAIIRSITENTLFPTNRDILNWLRNDNVFKATKAKDLTFAKLATELVKLESHLVLWIAKYQAWIPGRPEHALVYMADEDSHGLGFPTGIDMLVEEAVNKY